MKAEEYIAVFMEEAMDFMREKGIFLEFTERLNLRVQSLNQRR